MENFVTRMCRTIFLRGEWNIGIVNQPIHAFLDPDAEFEIYWLPTLEGGRFVADPFGIARDGRVYILCEKFDYGSRKGVISIAELTDRGCALHEKTAIDLPFHVSHPYLLEHQSGIYCVPETFQAGEIALYKAVEFPWLWKKAAILVRDIKGVDATVFQYKSHWWLTCTDQDDGPHHKLLIWHAPDLFGPWEPHAANPVKVDVRSSRPGVTPFVHNGSLYRPAQDCSETYGGRIMINRVVRLTPTEFEEEPAAVVGPFANTPYPDGAHTISAVGDITLIDAKRDVFMRKAFTSALMRQIGRVGALLVDLLR